VFGTGPWRAEGSRSPAGQAERCRQVSAGSTIFKQVTLRLVMGRTPTLEWLELPCAASGPRPIGVSDPYGIRLPVDSDRESSESVGAFA
jgi:hypothetical protein